MLKFKKFFTKIKQIGSRVKISGAIWKRENVPRILRLRCAYLIMIPNKTDTISTISHKLSKKSFCQ
jgi:hypothetical protein